jgi:tetratricopeptide (TPR) repeat protein
MARVSKTGPPLQLGQYKALSAAADFAANPHSRTFLSMNQASTVICKSLRLLLASACLLSNAYADEYADVSQLLRGNRYTEALKQVDAYLADKPADPQMRFFKGLIQGKQNQPEAAISTFTKMTEDYPELPEPYNNLAVLFAGQGQFEKARAALEMAIRNKPDYATAHENLGDVYARLASQSYSKALELDGNAAVQPKLALLAQMFKPKPASARTGGIAPLAPAASP